MSSLILHVGMGKAASTTIQKTLLDHKEAPINIRRQNIKSNDKKSIDKLWWRSLATDQKDRQVAVIDKLRKDYLDNFETVVLSDEVISSSSLWLENVATTVKELSCDVEILMITRIQESYLESLFNHSSRSKVSALGVPRLNSELLNRLTYHGGIDQWCSDLLDGTKVGDRNIMRVLDYFGMGMRLKEINPNLTIHFLPLELTSIRPKLFSNMLANVLRMPPETVEKLMTARHNVSGDRLRDYRFGRWLDSKVLSGRSSSLLKRTKIKKSKIENSLVPILKRCGLGARQSMSPIMSSRIRDSFAYSNDQLSIYTNINLDELGYGSNY